MTKINNPPPLSPLVFQVKSFNYVYSSTSHSQIHIIISMRWPGKKKRNHSVSFVGADPAMHLALPGSSSTNDFGALDPGTETSSSAFHINQQQSFSVQHQQNRYQIHDSDHSQIQRELNQAENYPQHSQHPLRKYSAPSIPSEASTLHQASSPPSPRLETHSKRHSLSVGSKRQSISPSFSSKRKHRKSSSLESSFASLSLSISPSISSSKPADSTVQSPLTDPPTDRPQSFKSDTTSKASPGHTGPSSVHDSDLYSPDPLQSSPNPFHHTSPHLRKSSNSSTLSISPTSTSVDLHNPPPSTPITQAGRGVENNSPHSSTFAPQPLTYQQRLLPKSPTESTLSARLDNLRSAVYSSNKVQISSISNPSPISTPLPTLVL